MKQLLSFLAGCLLATSALAAGLITPHSDTFKQCQQALPHAEQTLPGKNTLTRDEQAKLAAHLDMLAEQAVPGIATPGNSALGSRQGNYATSKARQTDELG